MDEKYAHEPAYRLGWGLSVIQSLLDITEGKGLGDYERITVERAREFLERENNR